MRPRHYGPWGTEPEEIQQAWVDALRRAKEQYPLSDPGLAAWAKESGESEEELQKAIAHSDWIVARQPIIEGYIAEEVEKERKT